MKIQLNRERTIKIQCIQGRLKRCSRTSGAVCAGVHVHDDEDDLTKLQQYMDICMFFGDISFLVSEKVSDEDCKRLLVESTLKLKYIEKRE